MLAQGKGFRVQGLGFRVRSGISLLVSCLGDLLPRGHGGHKHCDHVN